MDALSKLNKYERNFQTGSMVLNIRKREINDLLKNYLNPLIEIKNFNLGIGIGDDGNCDFFRAGGFGCFQCSDY